MATWNSTKAFQFRDMHMDYGSQYPYFVWDYSTTTDSLCIIEEIPEGRCAYGQGDLEQPKTIKEFMGEERAYALYLCLKNWVEVYKGEEHI